MYTGSEYEHTYVVLSSVVCLELWRIFLLCVTGDLLGIWVLMVGAFILSFSFLDQEDTYMYYAVQLSCRRKNLRGEIDRELWETRYRWRGLVAE
jgi:hypothetical protein